jgi:hypothetical protein
MPWWDGLHAAQAPALRERSETHRRMPNYKSTWIRFDGFDSRITNNDSRGD